MPTTLRLRVVPVILAAASIAACVPMLPARTDQVPAAATLRADTLIVDLASGQRCRGPRPPDAGEAGWSGRLEGCNAPYPYTVVFEQSTNPLRWAIEGAARALRVEDLLLPMAEVRVTGPDGREHVFRSPPPDRVE